jgi:hypothetical protein
VPDLRESTFLNTSRLPYRAFYRAFFLASARWGTPCVHIRRNTSAYEMDEQFSCAASVTLGCIVSASRYLGRPLVRVRVCTACSDRGV